LEKEEPEIMKGQLSIAETLARLEAQIALHRDKQAFHAEQKTHHQNEEARHTAELEGLSQHYAAFKAAASGVEAALPPPPAPTVKPLDDSDLGSQPKVSRALDRVVASWPAGVPFGASEVAGEVNHRFAGKLSLAARDAASYLRRRSLDGSLQVVREGRPFHETLYQKP
jgi:hypothetical protein